MTTSSEFSPRHVTDAQIRRGLALGRRARARAFGDVARAAFRFLVATKVKLIEGGRPAKHQTA